MQPCNRIYYSTERWNNKFYYKVASCWLFLLSHTTMHGSMNIKLTNIYFVYTVLSYSWWWTVDMSETRRVLYQI